MKTRRCVVNALLFAGLLQVVSCTKTIDTPANDSVSLESSSDATAANEFSNCKIRRIYQDVGYGFVETALFSYNKAGNPYSIIYANNGTGNPNHYFIYDSNNRLTEWRKMYGGFIVQHHFYKYNSVNQIVYDSTISREAGTYYVTVSAIEYDAMGRVIKETIRNTFNLDGPLSPTRRPTYTYDNRSNIGVLGWKSSSYDYKINPLRQNPIFQFLMRNYSMNNPAPQASYNSRGLPLSLHPSNDAFFNSYVTYKIVYDCQ